MPLVTVKMTPGRSAEQKQALVQALTDAVHEHVGARRELIWVMLEEVALDDWAIGGTLVSVRPTS